MGCFPVKFPVKTNPLIKKTYFFTSWRFPTRHSIHSLELIEPGHGFHFAIRHSQTPWAIPLRNIASHCHGGSHEIPVKHPIESHGNPIKSSYEIPSNPIKSSYEIPSNPHCFDASWIRAGKTLRDLFTWQLFLPTGGDFQSRAAFSQWNLSMESLWSGLHGKKS